MKLLNYTILALVVLVHFANGQYLGFQEEWVEYIGRYGTPIEVNVIDPFSMAVDPTGNIIVVKMTNAAVPQSKNDALIVKYNTNGDIVWTRTWKYIQAGVPDTLGEGAYDVVVDDAGYIYVSVSSNCVEGPVSTSDLVILKYSPDGTLVDSARYDVAGYDSDEMMYQLLLDHSTGNLYAGGYIKNYAVTMMPIWCVIKFDTNLDTVWRHELVSTIGSQIHDMIIDTSGNLYATGHTSSAITAYDWLTIKYNPVNGAIIDSAIYNCPSPGGQMDNARAITLDPNGNVIVGGNVNTNWGSPTVFQDFYTIKYDTDLNTIWARQYDFQTILCDAPTDVICDGSGNIYVTGNVQLNEKDSDIMTMKYSPSGNALWATRYSGPGFCADAAVKCLMNESVTEMYVAGFSSEIRTRGLNEWERDFLVLILNTTTGDTLQSLKYDGQVHFTDEIKDMVLDQNGNIFVTGTSREESDSQYVTITTIKYSRIVDNIPPENPYITFAEKMSSNVELTWTQVTDDTLGNSENMKHYVIYRNTSPDFVPGNPDSIGITSHPDTTYTDAGALNVSASYYYLVMAVDIANNKSNKSNMGFKLNKAFNNNIGLTSDRNWTSLPWHNDYATVSDLTDDLSPNGDPLNTITTMYDDQTFDSYVWNIVWGGVNFNIKSGYGYEMSATNDTSLFIVGANGPESLIVLNENAGAISDKNWVSIPYNAAYGNASDITDEYSPNGNPLTVLTNMLNAQLYESWLWFGAFWSGNNFAIERGRGYELVTIVDTTWNPTEYTNLVDKIIARKRQNNDLKVYLGDATGSNRNPVWQLEKDEYRPLPFDRGSQSNTPRVPGKSHIVRAELKIEDFDDILFTAYRVNKPSDVLTEKIIGSGIVIKDNYKALWFNVGNFMNPWCDGEEMVLITEATAGNNVYYSIVNFILKEGYDIQDLGTIKLRLLPELIVQHHKVSWSTSDDPNIIGYSLYHNGKRLNSKVITANEYLVSSDAVRLTPVMRGGYELISNCQSTGVEDHTITTTCSFTTYPTPFMKNTTIQYSLAEQGYVEISVYDVCGKKVNTLSSGVLKPGVHEIKWTGVDHSGRTVPAGIYFVRVINDQLKSQKKIVFVR